MEFLESQFVERSIYFSCGWRRLEGVKNVKRNDFLDV